MPLLDFFWLAGDLFEEVRREVAVVPRRVLVGVLLAMSVLFIESSAVICTSLSVQTLLDGLPLGRPDQLTMREEIASGMFLCVTAPLCGREHCEHERGQQHHAPAPAQLVAHARLLLPAGLTRLSLLGRCLLVRGTALFGFSLRDRHAAARPQRH
jgi:hypothetical protein